MTTQRAPAASLAPRPARAPWSTALLFVVSGAILLAQVLSHTRTWGSPWLLAPGQVRLPAAVTYAFFHADVLHWALNMALLVLIAPRLERAIGSVPVFALFLLGAVVAGLLHVSMVSIFTSGQQNQPLLGASGGIMALLGVYAVRYYNVRIAPIALPRFLLERACDILARLRAVHRGGLPALFRAPEGVPARAAERTSSRWASFSVPVGWVLFAWFLTESVLGWREIALGHANVAHWAHVGGFLAGMAIAVVTGMQKAGQREDAVSQRTLDQQAQRLAGYLRDHPEDVASRVTYARVLVQLGQRDKAARSYCRAIEAYLLHGNTRAAADTFLAMRAARLAPANPTTTVKGARALEETGHPEEALSVYDDLAGTRGPEAENAGLRAAHLAERLARPEEACQRYHAFLLMHPDSPFAPHARTRLDKLRG